MASPLASRSFWWATLLFAFAGVMLSLYAGYITESQGGVTSAEHASALRNQMLIATACATVLWVLVVGFYFSDSDNRIQQQRRFVEGVLENPSAEVKLPSGDDELGALSRTLRDIHPKIQELDRQARSELALRELILSNMAEGILAVDKDMRITFGNDTFVDYCGASSGPLKTGQHVLTVVRAPEFLELLSEAIRTGQPQQARMELAINRGLRCEVSARPFSAAGAIAVVRDVTELERLERARRDFVTNISHELRTPLAAIQGYAETLLEGGLSPESFEGKSVATIHRHAVRLGNVAADLLTLSEIEAGSTLEEARPFSIDGVIGPALRAVEAESQIRQVLLVRMGSADALVLGHRKRLEQALINLLDNGIRFNRPGGEVRVETFAPGDGTAHIIVTDTGIGIPSEHLSRIFERFYRVDKARSRETGGTGLGLSIVKHAVEEMKGVIQVESQIGKGTRFTILLPEVS